MSATKNHYHDALEMSGLENHLRSEGLMIDESVTGPKLIKPVVPTECDIPAVPITTCEDLFWRQDSAQHILTMGYGSLVEIIERSSTSEIADLLYSLASVEMARKRVDTGQSVGGVRRYSEWRAA